MHAAGTCSATVSMLKKWGTKRIVVIGVVGTSQGACLLCARKVLLLLPPQRPRPP